MVFKIEQHPRRSCLGIHNLGASLKYHYRNRRLFLSSHLPLDSIPRGIESGVVQLGLGANDHPAVAGKLEVRRCRAQIDLADQGPRRIPDLYAISAASVHVAIRVAVDTCYCVFLLVSFTPCL